MKNPILKTFTGLVLLSSLSALAAKNSKKSFDQLFPANAHVAHQRDFWIKVFTEHDDQQTIIHDRWDLRIIYDIVDHRGYSNRRRKAVVMKRFRKIKAALRQIRKKRFKKLNAYQKTIANKLPKYYRSKMGKAVKGLRYQQGMSNRFRKGLERSALYIDYIRKQFKKRNIPIELSFLPHVESSFNYKAYSRFGAAGIWQFMPGSARLYRLKINRFLDERLDPIASSKAAAWMLKDNYRILKKWPLAVAAYNHGPGAMKRAIRQTGSRKISVIINKYRHRSYGFASRNFYPSFLAAVTIARDPDKYLKNIQLPEPLRFEQKPLAKAKTIKQILFEEELDMGTFKHFNPFIKKIVYSKNLKIPKGTKIKLPSAGHRISQSFYQEKIKPLFPDKNDEPPRKPSEALGERFHIVKKGEILKAISNQYNVPLQSMIDYNELKSPNKLKVGQRLKVPALDQENTMDLFFQGIKQAAITADQPLTPLFDHQKLSSALPIKLVNSNKKEKQIVVAPYETVEHYSEWTGYSIDAIRRLNKLKDEDAIKVGSNLSLPSLDPGQVVQFESKREEFHREIELGYLENYNMSGTLQITVKEGETFENLAEHYHSPTWIIMRAQEKPAHKLIPGMLIKIPVLTARPENDAFDEAIQENDLDDGIKDE
jgi:membrane-bound lytic murein transglycosylase D